MKNERTKLLNGCSRTAVFISPKKYKTFTAKSNFPNNGLSNVDSLILCLRNNIRMVIRTG